LLGKGFDPCAQLVCLSRQLPVPFVEARNPFHFFCAYLFAGQSGLGGFEVCP
jgi:hypothetical protein